MGKIDAITKEYLKRNDIFADVINYAVYGGEPVSYTHLFLFLQRREEIL